MAVVECKGTDQGGSGNSPELASTADHVYYLCDVLVVELFFQPFES